MLKEFELCHFVGGLGTDRRECSIAPFEVAFDKGFL